MTPSWTALCRLAASQLGYFNRTQAQRAGYSRQLMQYYIQKALVERTARDGVFHLTRYPKGEHEDLIMLVLTTDNSCVFSHETALWLHGLHDGAPPTPTMTLPPAWRRRRLPEGVICHLEKLPVEVTQRLTNRDASPLAIENLPVTTPLRTLTDCLLRAALLQAPTGGAAEPEPDPILRKAINRAVQRGLCTRPALRRLLAERRQEMLGQGRPGGTGASGPAGGRA